MIPFYIRIIQIVYTTCGKLKAQHKYFQCCGEKKKSSNPGTPFYSWGNWGSEKGVNFPKVPNLERSRAGSAAGPADIRALPPPLGTHATYHRSMRVSVLSHVTVCGDILFTCQGLGLPACELFMVRSSCIFVPTLLLHRKYNDFMEVHREGDEFAQTPQHSAAKSRNQGLGEKREDDPASPCHCCSPTATPLPAKLPESDSHRATWSLHKGGSPFSPVPGPPQPCICWGLVKGLPTWLKNIFNINLNQNYTTMMDFHSKVFCHEFYGADLIFYVELLLFPIFFHFDNTEMTLIAFSCFPCKYLSSVSSLPRSHSCQLLHLPLWI